VIICLSVYVLSLDKKLTRPKDQKYFLNFIWPYNYSIQEEQLTSVSEQLQQSEGMRRRLHEQVTELQGRLALEEQRSKVCSIM